MIKEHSTGMGGWGHNCTQSIDQNGDAVDGTRLGVGLSPLHSLLIKFFLFPPTLSCALELRDLEQ